MSASAKQATLFAEDKTIVAQVTIDANYFGYPSLVTYQRRYFIFQDDQTGFHFGSVDAATSEAYLEAPLFSVS